eukprot:351900-Chlamydomonas_euryale.AAC.3
MVSVQGTFAQAGPRRECERASHGEVAAWNMTSKSMPVRCETKPIHQPRRPPQTALDPHSRCLTCFAASPSSTERDFRPTSLAAYTQEWQVWLSANAAA